MVVHCSALLCIVAFKKYEKTLQNQGNMVVSSHLLWYIICRSSNDLTEVGFSPRCSNKMHLGRQQRKLSKGILCPSIWRRATRDIYTPRAYISRYLLPCSITATVELYIIIYICRIIMDNRPHYPIYQPINPALYAAIVLISPIRSRGAASP